jgi:hypothetical protein
MNACVRPIVIGPRGRPADLRDAADRVIEAALTDAPDGAGIVVGVDGSPDSDTLLGFAFDEALRHGLSLHVVLCWNPSPLSGAHWMAGPAARDCEHLALWLSQTLLRWCAKYPDAMVTSAPTTFRRC